MTGYDDALIIGLDVGTTNIKTSAYKPTGELVAQTSQTYPTYYPNHSWAEQDPSDWKKTILECLQTLTAKLDRSRDRIAGLGISAHAPGFVPVDDTGSPLLERVPIWQDERCASQGEALLAEVGSEWVGLGMPMAAFAAKLRWFSETLPSEVSSAKYALGVKSYIVHWLTNEYVTDPSSEPGIELHQDHIWQACGWSPEQFVDVYPATAVVGELRQELVDDIGWTHTVPIVQGLNDGASATLANGALRAGEAVITLGTNGVIFLVSDSPIPSAVRLEKAIFCWPYLEDRWIVGGQTKSGACSLDWLASIVHETSDSTTIDHLLAEASQAPAGSGGVFFFPYLMGSGTPDDNPSATGVALGLSMQCSRGDLVRAVLEGVAFTLRDALEELQGQGLKVDSLSITGGGAKSQLWREIVAQVINRPIGYSEADSSLGAAMLASVGVGIHPDIDVAQRMMGPSVTIHQPDTQSLEIYDTIYKDFTRMREIILGLASSRTSKRHGL